MSTISSTRAQQKSSIRRGGPAREFRDATGEMVQSYMSWMQGRGKSAASVTRFLASVKSFYQFLIAQGDITVNPAKGIASAKVERKYR